MRLLSFIAAVTMFSWEASALSTGDLYKMCKPLSDRAFNASTTHYDGKVEIDRRIRLGGLVETGSVQKQADAVTAFRITDGPQRVGRSDGCPSDKVVTAAAL